MEKLVLALTGILAALIAVVTLAISACVIVVDEGEHRAPATAELHRSYNIDAINRSVSIEDGRKVGNIDLINGSIELGDDSSAGSLDSINGSIHLGDRVTVRNIDATNGRIRAGKQLTVRGSIDATNGSVWLGAGSRVEGDLDALNGGIELHSTQIAGAIESVNSSLETGPDSRIVGGIRYRKATGWFNNSGNSRAPRIVIGPRTEVLGAMQFERAVELWVHQSASIAEVVGAEVRTYSGERPPSN